MEGEWGAGKSTVLRLLANELESERDSETRVVVFDAWAHQGDPLRRTFLEKLIRRLQVDGWVDKSVWDDQIEKLTKRRRESTQRVVPQLTKYGIVFALSLLAIPTGSALIAAGTTSLTADEVSYLFASLFLSVGLAGLLMPVCVLGIVGIRRWYLIRVKKLDQDDLEDSGGLPALVTGQATTTSRSVVSETLDPTSVEFERTFRKLCNEALGSGESRHGCERKLVLAIDNLDRVDSGNALAIWATLQTFLQYSEHERPAWFTRIWVVVPFDRRGILKLWGSAPGDEKSSQVGLSFLDKTFQMRFRIPPPAIANWRSFLREALKAALPDHSEQDFHDVYRAFALRQGMEGAKPTPRSLKLFVNEIGAIHRQWRHLEQFTLADFATFVLLQRDDATEGTLRSTIDSVDARFAQRVAGGKWRDTLAVLYFNTPIKQARQLLLREPIEKALVTADGQALRELEEANGDAFWAVFEDAVPAGAVSWGDAEPVMIALSATALSSSGLVADESEAKARRELASLLAEIGEAAAKVAAWDPFSVEVARGLVALCRIAGFEESHVKDLTSAVSAAEVRREPPDNGSVSVSPETWIKAALELLQGLGDLGFPLSLAVPLSADAWIESTSSFLIDDPVTSTTFTQFELTAAAEIDIALSEESAPETISEESLHALELTLRTLSTDSMTRTADQVVSGVGSYIGVRAQNIVLLTRALVLCQANGLIPDDKFKALATQGSLLHHLYQGASEANAEATSRCAYLYLQITPSASPPENFAGNAQAGHNALLQLLQNPNSIAGALDSFVELNRNAGGVRELAYFMDSNPPSSTLFDAVFEQLIDSDPLVRDIEFIRNHWGKIRANLPIASHRTPQLAFEAFLAKIPSLDRLVDLLIAESFAIESAPFYLAVLRSEESRRFSGWCAAGLRSISAQDWQNSFLECNEIIGIVMELRQRKLRIGLGPNFLDGIVSNATAAATSEVNEGVHKVLPELIEEADQELLPRRVYEVLEETNGSAYEPFFELYGELIANRNFLVRQPRFVDLVCRPLLIQMNVRGLLWLADLCRVEPQIFVDHGDHSAITDFGERVRGALSELDESHPAYTALPVIAQALNVEVEDSQ